MDHSPFDVVAWRGNDAPYKYDLRRFNTIGSISYDHPDPSIFLVLQSITDTPGVDEHRFCDFPAALAGDGAHLPSAVVSSQYRQRIHGADRRRVRRQGRGLPARRRLAAQLHERSRAGCRDLRDARAAPTPARPQQITDTMAFMFETRCVIRPTRYALESPLRQRDYAQCWQGLREHFDPRQR